MKARLIVTYRCYRDCVGCCNKDWKYDPPEIITHYHYDEILITGGEPLLFPEKVIKLAQDIRVESSAKIYVYTAMPCMILNVLPWVDGVCLTLHNQFDIPRFNHLIRENHYKFRDLINKSLRLNIFKKAMTGRYKINSNALELFKIKDNIEWLKDCPLPKDEKLFKLRELF